MFMVDMILNVRRRERDMAHRQVEALGFSARDVRQIVLTHLDFDHACSICAANQPPVTNAVAIGGPGISGVLGRDRPDTRSCFSANGQAGAKQRYASIVGKWRGAAAHLCGAGPRLAAGYASHRASLAQSLDLPCR
jgi:hypothetical protein